jgi:O-antigen/teichoic acid export membrane protein
MAALGSGSTVAQVMTALAVLLTARQLGPIQYGQYASSLLLATFCSLLFNLGLDLWLLREGGLQPDQIAQSASSVLIAKFLLGLAWLVARYLLAPLVQSTTLVVELVRLGAINTWLYSLFMTALTSFKAVLQNRINATIEAAMSATRLLGTIALVVSGIKQITHYIYLQTFVYLAGLVLALALIRLRLGFQPHWKTIQNALRRCLPYAASEFLAWSFMRMDALLVALLLTPQAVSIYSLAESILGMAFLVPNTVMSVTIPALSRLFTSQVDQAWQMSRRSLKLLFGSGLLLCLGLFVGAPVLGWLLGPGYQGIIPVLRGLSIIIWLHSITAGYAAILVATDQQSRRTVVQGVAVMFNLVMNLWIAPRAGLIGVTGVFIATEIILLAGYAWLAIPRRVTA